MPDLSAQHLVERITTACGARLLRTRWLMRAPIALYRAHLGFLLGSRVLLLQHTGRRTGAARLVVLEVIDRPTPDSYVVASGFGTRAQWFRNVRADPRVRVSSGRITGASATARVLARHEADAALATYIRRHPRAWARLGSTIERTLGHPVDETGAGLPMVELRLDG